MEIALPLVSILAVLGYAFHRARLRTLGRDMERDMKRDLERRTGVEMEAHAARRDEAERRADEIAGLDRARCRVLLGMMRELRTPLMMLRSPLQTSMRLAGPAHLDGDDIERMMGQTRRMQRSVEQMQELLELDLGAARPTFREADFATTIERLVMSLRPLAERKGVTVEFSTELDALPFTFDESRLEQAVRALVDRAFSDMASGDKLQVYLTAEDDGPDAPGRVVLDVIDNGRPIDERYLRVIRSRGEWTSFEESLGDAAALALGLAHRSVLLHGGALEVEPLDDRGTRVRIRLPRRLVRTTSADTASAADSTADGNANAVEGKPVGTDAAIETPYRNDASDQIDPSNRDARDYTPDGIVASARDGAQDRCAAHDRSVARDRSTAQDASTAQDVSAAQDESAALGARTVRDASVVQDGSAAHDRDAAPGRGAAPEGGDASERDDAPDGDETAEKSTTVLIVDDHPGTRGYLAYALRRHHNILEAADGAEALDLVRELQPDLVISDIMMPVMDGTELCRAIKSDEGLRHIPVFLVTANAIPTIKMEGLESGADDYLVKPFDLAEAIVRINNEIKSRAELRERYTREVVIRPSDITVTSADEAFLNRTREIIEDNIDEGNFGVQELASELGLSPRQLQRRLRDTVDQSPVEFIRNLRLQRAAQLLEARYGNVSEVAYSVGFTSLSYFAKCFREQFGTTPSEFKAEQAA